MTANVNQFRPFRVGVNTNLRTPRRIPPTMGRFGASSQQEIQAGSAAAGAAAGAAYGSVVPGIGTAVGAAVGLIASFLVHTGQGAQRLAQAQAIDSGLAGITTANHQGAAIPWNGSASAPGLLQFISALMTAGLYMSWDPSVESSPSVNGNWSTCFQNAVIAVTKAIVANPAGASVTVPITISGAKGSPVKNFTFNNPGISVGPDVIAANIIMGQGGLMYFIIISIGETSAHASANANNSAAQKVFALMVDHAAYDAVPPSTVAAPLPVPAATVTAPVALSTDTAQPTVIGNTSQGTPVVASGDESALVAQLIAQGQSQQAAVNAALASIAANGQQATPAQTQALQTVAATTPSSGISTSTMLLVGGIAAAAYLLTRK